jgi:hypothetical protein
MFCMNRAFKIKCGLHAYLRVDYFDCKQHGAQIPSTGVGKEARQVNSGGVGGRLGACMAICAPSPSSACICMLRPLPPLPATTGPTPSGGGDGGGDRPLLRMLSARLPRPLDPSGGGSDSLT